MNTYIISELINIIKAHPIFLSILPTKIFSNKFNFNHEDEYVFPHFTQTSKVRLPVNIPWSMSQFFL